MSETEEERLVRTVGIAVLWVMVAGCVTEPPPVVVHEDPHLSVWLMFDPEAKQPGHSHPITFTQEQVETVLKGLSVVDRNEVIGEARELFSKGQETTPAFSPAQIRTLAPLLAQAFKKASPVDMVTFYFLLGEKRVTSGGLFVRNGRLYFIVANFRTSPSTKIYETTYELDARDSPLLPVARFLYFVGFTPQQAWISTPKARSLDGYERYMDESKLVVIDLAQLFGSSAPLPTK